MSEFDTLLELVAFNPQLPEKKTESKSKTRNYLKQFQMLVRLIHPKFQMISPNNMWFHEKKTIKMNPEIKGIGELTICG